MARQEWQVKSGKSRVTSQEQRVKSDMLKLARQGGHFMSDNSRMKNQKWQVKSGMLKATRFDKFWRSDLIIKIGYLTLANAY